MDTNNIPGTPLLTTVKTTMSETKESDRDKQNAGRRWVVRGKWGALVARKLHCSRTVYILTMNIPTMNISVTTMLKENYHLR